jgi:hypothetical protein
MLIQSEALKLLESTLNDLESPKGTILSAIQKLYRAADLVEDEDVKKWCAIQLADQKYTDPLGKLLNLYREMHGKKKGTKIYDELSTKITAQYEDLKKLGLNKKHFNSEELNSKYNESGGGYVGIGFLEERYFDLVRLKDGNDGTYYKNDLYKHLSYVRKLAHEYAKELFKRLKFSGTVKSCFDTLKDAVDDRLLEIKEELGEQLMLVFKALSSDKPEEWSHALTSCRRLIEGLADELYPPSEEKRNGRALGKGQYINRLWAFMDDSITSSSNKDLAKSHVDYLGAWLQGSYKLTNKGVHSGLTQIEATKAVFHTYLMISDILEYINLEKHSNGKKNINEASIDELEVILDVKRGIAKNIVKKRIENGILTLQLIKDIPGVGPKILSKIQAEFDI